MAELTSTGLVTETQAEILDAIEADQRAEISDSLDQSTSSPLGQLNRLFARSVALAEEALAALYLSLDPDAASGDALLRLCALTGTIREPATASRVVVTCDLDAGTYAAGSLSASPAGRPGDVFRNLEEVTSAGGSTDVLFECLSTGPVQAAEDTLEIAAPVSGWVSIESHPTATLGRAIETEAALRLRRRQEVESPGSSSAAGIVADITRNLPLVEAASVTENDTDSTVDSVPPHSIEVIVFGPADPSADDDQAVAAQILASKAAGIGTYGNTTETVTDSQGVDHVVSFTRPVPTATTCSVTVKVQSTLYAGDVALRTHIAERAAELLVPGLDVSWSQIAAWCHEVTGVLRVVSVSVQGVAFTDRSITSRQIATIALSDITASSSGATP